MKVESRGIQNIHNFFKKKVNLKPCQKMKYG